MARYPNIHSIVPLYNCKRPCKICGSENSDRRVEIRFNCFRGSNVRYDAHQVCIDKQGKDDGYQDRIMKSLGLCLTIEIPHGEFLKWRRNLVNSGYGCYAKVNIDVMKGILVPGNASG